MSVSQSGPRWSSAKRNTERFHACSEIFATISWWQVTATRLCNLCWTNTDLIRFTLTVQFLKCRERHVVCSRTTSSEEDDRVVVMAPVQRRRSLKSDSSRRRSCESQPITSEMACPNGSPVDVASVLPLRRRISTSAQTSPQCFRSDAAAALLCSTPSLDRRRHSASRDARWRHWDGCPRHLLWRTSRTSHRDAWRHMTWRCLTSRDVCRRHSASHVSSVCRRHIFSGYSRWSRLFVVSQPVRRASRQSSALFDQEAGPLLPKKESLVNFTSLDQPEWFATIKNNFDCQQKTSGVTGMQENLHATAAPRRTLLGELSPLHQTTCMVQRRARCPS